MNAVRLTEEEINNLNEEIQSKRKEQPPKGLGMTMFKVVKKLVKVPARNVDTLVSELPMSFQDGRYIVYEHGFVKLFNKDILIKEFPAKKEDKIKFAKNTIYKTTAPKERWKKLLWELSLTKGNWRHPKMIKFDDVVVAQKIVCIDKEGNENELTVWVLKSGFRAWYTKPKMIKPNILLLMAEEVSKIANKDWTGLFYKEIDPSMKTGSTITIYEK